MSFVDMLLQKALGTGWSQIARRLGIAGPAGAAMGAYEFTTAAVEEAMRAGAAREAVPAGSEVRRLLDSVVRSSSGLGEYHRDYAYYEADYLAAARKDVLASRGILTLIRMRRNYHARDAGTQLWAGNLYLVVTRAMALTPTDDFEIVASVAIIYGTASSEASSAFIRSFVEVYVPFVEARRARIRAFEGHPRFGQQPLLY